MIDQSDQGARRQQGGLAGPGRLRPAGFGADQAQAHGAGGHGGRERAGHRRDLAGEAEFADRRPAIQGILRNDPHHRHQGQGYGQVVVIAFLRKIRRREIGDEAFGRQGEAEAREGRAHSLARLPHGLVGQAHHDEGRLAADRLDLHVHPPRLDALERHRDHPRGHAIPRQNPAQHAHA